jgi:hypothetical protein
VGVVADGLSVGVGAEEVSEGEPLNVSVGVAVSDVVDVSPGVGDRLGRLGCGVLVCDGVGAGAGLTPIVADDGRTSR